MKKTILLILIVINIVSCSLFNHKIDYSAKRAEDEQRYNTEFKAGLLTKKEYDELMQDQKTMFEIKRIQGTGLIFDKEHNKIINQYKYK